VGKIVAGVVVGLLVLAIGAAWVWGRRAKAALVAQYPPPGQMVDVGGYRMHLHCQGDKRGAGSPTVILDAGNAEFSLTWALVQPKVAEFARVCAYDRAGLGWSERSPNPRTAPYIVEELHSLLAHAGVEPLFVLVGHSMGGVFARLYAHTYPDQVAGMVLVDAGHGEEEARFPGALPRLSNRSYKMIAWSFRLLRALNAIGIPLLPSGKAEGPWPTPIPEPVRETYLGVTFSGTRHFETASKEAASIRENFAAARAARITGLGEMPLVVLSPAEQPAEVTKLLSAEDAQQLEDVTEELQAELAALSPNGRHVRVPESGHYIQIDQPDAVVDAIHAVVEDLERR
jgi:pimeloyl-ACP methyl ester carboxylesterase